MVVAGVRRTSSAPWAALGQPALSLGRDGRPGLPWWIERFRTQLALWDICADGPLSWLCGLLGGAGQRGDRQQWAWLPGPGATIGLEVRDALGQLPIIAENLGLLTPEAEELRDHFGLPGMRSCFAFAGDPSNLSAAPLQPHCVVYTGTHDNDTTLGWFARVAARALIAQRYLGRDGADISWDLIRRRGSVADGDRPLQDALGGQRGAHEQSRPGRRQLVLALQAGDARGLASLPPAGDDGVVRAAAGARSALAGRGAWCLRRGGLRHGAGATIQTSDQ